MNDTFHSAVRDLLWGVWHELGVPGVVRLTSSSIIDLERLIIHTPLFAAEDPRLDEMAFSWCVHNHSLIGSRRIRALAAESSPVVAEAFWRWSAELRARVRINWIGAREAVASDRYVRCLLPDLQRPALAALRARAVFGVGARADIICALLERDGEWLRVTDLTEQGYSKNAVAAVLVDLTRAGLLAATRRGNSDLYRLEKTMELGALLGTQSASWLPWQHLFRVFTVLTLLEGHRAKSEAVQLVEAVRAKGEIQPAVVALKWPEPPATDRFAPAPIPALLAWGKAQIETLMNR